MQCTADGLIENATENIHRLLVCDRLDLFSGHCCSFFVVEFTWKAFCLPVPGVFVSFEFAMLWNDKPCAC